ncbi:DnaD domain protein [Staphylococcus ureilyticus]|uniref:DnaD domain protein n=1 Tax=Staphylococcus ureilyticus TaxID=94138 RepID=UPI00387B650C
MSKLLIDDYPIQVLPKLAEHIGLNEAIILQQMHYWLNASKHSRDDKKWIYNSYKNWEKQFPFWSNVTIRRTISSLEKQNLLFTGNFNKAGFDKTKWYSINYEVLEGMSKRVAQNEQTNVSKRANGDAQNEQTNTIDYTETSTDSIDTSKIFEYISKELHPVSNMLQVENLDYEINLIKNDAYEITKIAVDYCKEKDKGIPYLISILKNWNKEGIDTVEKATAKVTPKQRKQSKKESDDLLERKRKELMGG